MDNHIQHDDDRTRRHAFLAVPYHAAQESIIQDNELGSMVDKGVLCPAHHASFVCFTLGGG